MRISTVNDKWSFFKRRRISSVNVMGDETKNAKKSFHFIDYWHKIGEVDSMDGLVSPVNGIFHFVMEYVTRICGDGSSSSSFLRRCVLDDLIDGNSRRKLDVMLEAAGLEQLSPEAFSDR